jgi:hypothetical protein
MRPSDFPAVRGESLGLPLVALPGRDGEGGRDDAAFDRDMSEAFVAVTVRRWWSRRMSDRARNPPCKSPSSMATILSVVR